MNMNKTEDPGQQQNHDIQYKSPLKRLEQEEHLKSTPIKQKLRNTPIKTPQSAKKNESTSRKTPIKKNAEQNSESEEAANEKKQNQPGHNEQEDEKIERPQSSENDNKNNDWRQMKLLSPYVATDRLDEDNKPNVAYGFNTDLFTDMKSSPITNGFNKQNNIGFEKITKETALQDYNLNEKPINTETPPKKKSQMSTNPPRVSSGSSFSRLLVFFVLPIIVSAVILRSFVYFPHKNSETNSARINVATPVMKSKFDVLKNRLVEDFPNQSKQFHLNILSTYKHSVLQALDPSIVLLVSDNKSGKNLKCVTEKLLTVLADKTDVNNIRVSPIDLMANGTDAQDVKIKLDKKLEEVFGESRIGVVENIELIPPQSMILFYTYGDDVYTAKFPGILLMFTLQLDIELTQTHHLLFSNNVSKFSQFLEDYLKNLWESHIDSDQLLPLLARIANNLILINNEKYCN